MKYMTQKVYQRFLEKGFRPSYSANSYRVIKNWKAYKELTFVGHEGISALFPISKAQEIMSGARRTG